MKSPRVSEILNPYAGYEDVPADRLAEASERGTRRHAAASSIALRVPILHKNPDDAGYIRSFGEWLSRYVVRSVLVSQRLYDPALNYSGEPDFIFDLVPMIPDLRPGDLVVVDLKPEWTQPQPAWRAQVAAYVHLAKENRFPVKMGATLHPDQEGGPAKLEWCEQSPRDFAAFLNCLAAWNYFYGGKNAKNP